MENTTARGRALCRLSIGASLIFILGGMGLCAYFFGMLSAQRGVEVWKFIFYEVLALLPIVGGGIWLAGLYRRRSRDRRGGMWGVVLFGAVLVAAGIVLFIFSSGMVMAEWKRVIVSWQMLLVVIGVIQLCKADAASGITFLAVGTFFLIPRIDSALPGVIDVSPDFVSSYWPVLIMIFGVSLILGIVVRRHGSGERRHNCTCGSGEKGRQGDEYQAEPGNPDGTVCYSYFFSGSEQVFLEPVFRGGSIRAVFGGMELDLRHTSLPEGSVFLRVDAVFGGVEIKVPDDWNIVLESHSIFGGVQDERGPYKLSERDGGRKLVIVANCVFGGCSIE